MPAPDRGGAACALVWDARLWTLNVADFRDIPGLRVARPSPASETR